LHGPKTALFSEGYIIDGAEPGPTAMIIGGIHPNEHASKEAVREAADSMKVRKGRVILLPTLNRAADLEDVRGLGGVDMNRIFSPNVKRVAETELAEAVKELAKEYNVRPYA